MATTWHLILNAVESQVGTWVMIGPLDQPYALVTIVRNGGEFGYRVTTFEHDDQAPTIIGYNWTLIGATKGAHSWFTATRGPSGRPFAAWGGE